MKKIWFVFACMTLAGGVSAATNSTPPPSSLSLQDCIKFALERNLGLRIQRYQPQIALYNLKAAKAGYEPTLDLLGQRSHDEAGSRLLQGGFLIPGSESDQTYTSGGLSGLTPWGMTYNITANASETKGNSFSAGTNNSIISSGFKSSSGAVGIDVTQPLLKNMWIDGQRLSVSTAKNLLKSSEFSLRQAIIDVVSDVEQSYYNVQYAKEQVKVQEKAVELAQKLHTENRKRVEVGTMAPLDEKQAEAQAATSQADLIAARRNLALLQNTLKTLINDNFSAWSDAALELTDPMTAELQLFNRQDSWTKAFAQRPDYQISKLELERIGLQLKFDHNQLFPQLDVFGSYGYNGSGVTFDDSTDELRSGDRPYWLYGGRFSFPLGNGAARNTYRTSKATREQLLLGLKSQEQTIMVEVDNAITLAESSYERVGATRKASEYALAALDAEQKKMESGKSTSFVVLDLQSQLTSARSAEIQALSEYRKSLAALARAEGSTLYRLGVDVQVK